jgi:hypothetical protein
MTASICETLISASSDALTWNDQAATVSHRVKLDHSDNTNSFLRSRLAARKLKGSSGRSPCVGVFGPSQAGKSYLVSALSKGKQSSLQVKLGAEYVDFLQKINPGGGRESTGVVTRFSLLEPKVTHPEFPVEIRLLSESDVLKILFNSFYSDFDHAGKFSLQPLTDEEIRSRLDSLKNDVDKKNLNESIQPEDVLDLKNYLENDFGNLVIDLKRDFWPIAISIAPLLSIEKRAQLFAIVWRDFSLFTEIYKQLASAIHLIKFADTCLVPIHAVVSGENSASIVDAQLLEDLGNNASESVSIYPVIKGKLASQVSLFKPMLAALTAELRLTIPDSGWHFLNDLDILDFPGARSRLKISDPDRFEGDKNTQAAELFLRGKVAYLFQRYTEEQELSSVLLCVPWGPQEVTGYAPLIDRWVRETCGENPEKRKAFPPGLLLVLTKFDMDLQSKGGDSEASERQRWPDRIKSSLLERFGNLDWVADWNGNAFNNIYWLRNPEIKDTAYMAYEAGAEVGINPSHKERLDRLKTYFTEDEAVKKHFDQPAEAWDAAMTPGDGGITRIVQGVDRLSNPAFRANNLRDRSLRIADILISRLDQYFNQGRDQEIAKKVEIYTSLKTGLNKLIRDKNIWKLLEMMNLSLEELRALYFAVATGKLEEETPIQENDDYDIDNYLDQMLEPSSNAKPGSNSAYECHVRATQFANKVVDVWASKVRELAEDSKETSFLEVNQNIISLLGEELITAAQRCNLANRLAVSLNPAEINAGATWEKIVDRQSIIARNTIGDFVDELGMAEMPLNQRPGIPPDNPKRRAFEPFKNFDGTPPLTPTALPIPLIFSRDWLVGLERVVIENAGFVGEGDLTPEMNRSLGKIIEDIQKVKVSS